MNPYRQEMQLQFKRKKICVLITVQESAKRLIDQGLSEAAASGGELHLLHVQKGRDLLRNKETIRLLWSLMEYGGRCGAEIHILCAENTADTIGDFVSLQKIDTVVMGEPSGRRSANGETEFSSILLALPEETEVISVPAQQAYDHSKLIG